MDLVRSIADRLNRWRSRFSISRTKSKPAHLRRGARGEKLACRFLRRHGYKILYRNFRGRRGGEIDLVCRDGDTLVFVEVKTRTRRRFRPAIRSIRSPSKRERISRGGLAWLRLLDNPDILFRFDVVEVVLGESEKPSFELIRSAFQLPDRYIY